MSGTLSGLGGDYEVRGVLGTGATGTVYLAYQPFLDRRVAIKELSSELTGDPSFRERFRAEAEVMSHLESDHCVRVFDYQQRPEHDYLVTELVEGASLRKIIDQSGGLTPEESLGVLKGALQGLADAHARGLLHRDVKPENILVDTEGVSKLADFGLAVMASGPGAMGGLPAGTPAYMSPEAVSGGVVDARSDLYSAIAVTYETMTGRAPFVADNPLAVMRMQREAPPPDPRERDPRLGVGVAAFLMGGLAKDPGARPQSAQEMLAQLESVAAMEYGADWESRSSLKRRVAEAVGAGLGLLAGLSAVGAAAAAGAIGSVALATTAMAAGGGAGGGVLGISTAWLAAGGVAALALLGGGGYLLLNQHHGSGKSSGSVALSSPSASPSEVMSPTPDVSPSPTPDATPSPSPSAEASPTPTQTPTNRPAPRPTPTQSQTNQPPPPPPVTRGPVTVSSAVAWLQCSSATPNCPTSPTAEDGTTSPTVSPCGSEKLSLWESYHFDYANTPGQAVTINVQWQGTTFAPATGTQPYTSGPAQPSQTVTATGDHAYTASASFTPPVTSADQKFSAQFFLTWTNPDGSAGNASSPVVNFTCG